MKKVGEIFKHNRHLLMPTINNDCSGCFFIIGTSGWSNGCSKDLFNSDYNCSSFDREDRNSIIFKIYIPFKFGK